MVGGIMQKKVYTKHYRSGFTLVELLLVIFIIGLLASIVVVAVNSARIKARDGRRIADVTQVRNAVEMFADQSGTFPSTGGNWQDSGSNPTNWVPGLTPTFISVLPQDPINRVADCNREPCPYFYYYKSDGNNYKVYALIEGDYAKAINDGGRTARNVCPPVVHLDRLCAYELFSSGAQDW